jgi:uncharacterized protein YkwD
MKFGYIIKAVLALVLIAMVPSRPAAADDYAAAISSYRRANGLAPVKTDGRLNALAQRQAAAMSRAGKVSHNVAGDFRDRIAKLRRRVAAENVAAGELTFSATLKQWIDSAGHRENLLTPDAKRVGVAFVSNPGSPYRRFWAMIITD